MVIFKAFCSTMFHNAWWLFVEPKHLTMDSNIESVVFDCDNIYIYIYNPRASPPKWKIMGAQSITII